MLKNEELRVEIIQLHHNVLAAEHRERWKIMELVTRNYQWPKIIKDIRKYVKECDLYQKMKNRTEVPAGKLMINKVLERL